MTLNFAHTLLHSSKPPVTTLGYGVFKILNNGGRVWKKSIIDGWVRHNEGGEVGVVLKMGGTPQKILNKISRFWPNVSKTRVFKN